jgi:hypothetical protein
VSEATITLNYTTVLNVIFLILAAVLVVRFLRTGGPAMLRMMSLHEGKTPSGPGTHRDSDISDPRVGLYRCPMHPDVHESTPGRCAKCGMQLVPTQ